MSCREAGEERKRKLAGLDGKIFIKIPSENLFLEERETALFVRIHFFPMHPLMAIYRATFGTIVAIKESSKQ